MNTFRTRSAARILTSILLLTMLLTLQSVVVAQTANNGTISGTVQNETTGEPLTDTEVTLSAFTTDGLVGEFLATSDESGQFTFTEVDTTDGIVYAASVSYRGVLYSSGMIQLGDSDEQTTTISVFETTTDRSVVTINSRGLVLSELNPEEGSALFLDITSFMLQEDLTFTAGDTGRSLEMPIPRQAGSPTLLPGFDFGTAVVENSVLYASSSLRPPGGSASINYSVQYTDTSLALDVLHLYPTETFRILVPTDLTQQADSITVAGAGLESDGIATIGEREYHVWSVTNLEQDASIRASFGGLPESEFEPNTLRILEPAILAGVALFAATAATVVMIRRKKFTPAEPETEAAVTAGFVESREELVTQLQELQDEYENGMIEEDLYLSERRQLLERLRAVSRHLRDLPDEPGTAN